MPPLLCAPMSATNSRLWQMKSGLCPALCIAFAIAFMTCGEEKTGVDGESI